MSTAAIRTPAAPFGGVTFLLCPFFPSPRRSVSADAVADKVISAPSAGVENQSKQAKLIQDADIRQGFAGAENSAILLRQGSGGQGKQAKLIQDAVLNQLLRSKPSQAELIRDAVSNQLYESQAKPSGAKPSQAKPSQAKPSQAEPSQAKPSQAKPSQAKPSQAKPSQAFI